MDGGDHHGALADRRRHPLDGPGAHVTDGEHPGHRRREAVVGDDEALGVELDAHLVQPGRARVRADHQEEAGCVEPDVPLEDVVAPGQRAEPARAMDRGQLRARVDGDPFVVSEALRQVVRHRVAEVVTADQDVDLVGVPGQEQGGLAGRVGAPHHDGVPAGHHLGLELARGVVDAASLEVGQAGHVQAPIPDAAGDDHGARHDVALVVEPDAEASGHLRQPRDGAGGHQPRPELDGLQHRGPRQLGPGNAPVEAEVVLDPRRAAGLAPDGDVLDDDHVQPLRGPIDGGRQPRWSGSHDEQVTSGVVGKAPQVDPERGRQIARRRCGHDPPVSRHHDRAGLGQRGGLRQL